jgi:hypothetical protein
MATTETTRTTGDAEREARRDATELAGARRGRSLFFGLLTGPLMVLVGQMASYAIVPGVCRTIHRGPLVALHAVMLASLALTAAAGLVAWRDWHEAGAEWEAEGAGPIPRSRFLSLMGVVGSAFFGLIIVAMWLAVAFVHPCQAA